MTAPKAGTITFTSSTGYATLTIGSTSYSSDGVAHAFSKSQVVVVTVNGSGGTATVSITI